MKEDAPRSWKDRQKGQEGNGTCDLKSTSTAMGPERLWFSVLGKQRKSLKAWGWVSACRAVLGKELMSQRYPPLFFSSESLTWCGESGVWEGSPVMGDPVTEAKAQG